MGGSPRIRRTLHVDVGRWPDSYGSRDRIEFRLWWHMQSRVGWTRMGTHLREMHEAIYAAVGMDIAERSRHAGSVEKQ